MQRLMLILAWSDATSLCKEAMMSELSWMIFPFSTITSSFAFNSLDFLSKWDSSITNKEKCIRKQRQHIHHTTNPHLDVKKENFQYRKPKVLILSKYVVCHIFNRPRKTRLVSPFILNCDLGCCPVTVVSTTRLNMILASLSAVVLVFHYDPFDAEKAGNKIWRNYNLLQVKGRNPQTINPKIPSFLRLASREPNVALWFSFRRSYSNTSIKPTDVYEINPMLLVE